MGFEQNTRREDSLIPNSQIETMFLRIATDEMMEKYKKHISDGYTNLATSYASGRVFEMFFLAVDDYERRGVDITYLREEKQRRNKTLEPKRRK